jgi:hypothetical protein
MIAYRKNLCSLKILCLSLVFAVQKGKFLAAEKFALLPAPFLKHCPGEAQHPAP